MRLGSVSLSKKAAQVWPQLMARHPGDPLELDDKLGVDEGLAVHPVGDRLLWPSDRTSEGGLTAHAAAGVRHGLAHVAFLGFGGHLKSNSARSVGTPLPPFSSCRRSRLRRYAADISMATKLGEQLGLRCCQAFHGEQPTRRVLKPVWEDFLILRRVVPAVKASGIREFEDDDDPWF